MTDRPATEDLPELSVVPVARTLGLACPECGGLLEDRVGPFWCPACKSDVSAWTVLLPRLGHMSGGPA